MIILTILIILTTLITFWIRQSDPHNYATFSDNKRRYNAECSIAIGIALGALIAI